MNKIVAAYLIMYGLFLVTTIYVIAHFVSKYW